MIDASIASNTKDTYNTGLQCFTNFRIVYKLDNIWPPPCSHIVLFVAYLSMKGKAYKTANCYLSAINFRCKFLEPQNFIDFSKNFIVIKMLEGLKRSKNTTDQRLPITSELLFKISNVLSSVCSSSYETLLFTTAFSLAFHGFLRVGEIVYTKLGQEHQILSLNDVHILEEGGSQFIRLHLKHSKCDQTGKGATVDIQKTNSKICPVNLLQSFLTVRSSSNGPLFCHFNGSYVTRYQFSSILNKSLRVLGIDSSGYKNHSFRIGGASEWSVNGRSVQDIMKMGRWKSEAYKSYIRC